MQPRHYERIGARRRGPGKATLIITLLVILFGASSLASYVIEYQWWREMGQVETWLDMLAYGLAPVAAATLLAFCAFWIAHARGMKLAYTSLRDNPTYAKLATLALLVVAYVVAASSFENWTAVRYIGSRGLPAEATAWKDPVFGLPLSFISSIFRFTPSCVVFYLP